jgi:hypothetical protein
MPILPLCLVGYTQIVTRENTETPAGVGMTQGDPQSLLAAAPLNQTPNVSLINA